ncbi:MAG TPA: ATP-binding protein [Petrimonas mucosa]|jgi:DNA replication protein DnaC|nr:ATP-binding protein [Petrimonas mucosa]
MSQYLSLIRQNAARLRLSGISSNVASLLEDAGQNAPSYDKFLSDLLSYEVRQRENKRLVQQMKLARLPLKHDLDSYDYGFESAMSATQLKQLRELNWLDQCYNIMLSGPTGTGKTYIAAGLAYDAICKGYKAFFRNMSDILSTLRLKELTASASKEFKRLSEAQLLIIDDVMTLPLGREDGNRFFVFINRIYETTSFIITTNKSPAEWAKSLDDETLATAILDRLLYKCQLIQFHGPSYRMENRQTIF